MICNKTSKKLVLKFELQNDRFKSIYLILNFCSAFDYLIVLSMLIIYLII